MTPRYQIATMSVATVTAIILAVELSFPAKLSFAQQASTTQGNSPQPKPEQVHLALGGSPTEIVVTWMTDTATSSSVVQYGKTAAALNLTSTGSSTKFTDGGKERRVTYVQRVTFTVEPGQLYHYRVGTGLASGWSDVFNFTAPRSSPENWTPRLAFYGDLGLENGRSFEDLRRNVQANNFDLIIHAGDFGYDMDMDSGRLGDRFMRMIELLAAYVPYMTCVGNHEVAYNFSHYTNRFSMPGGSNNSMFYSFNYATAHFIAIDTEFYFTNPESILTQYNWLVEDLKIANQPDNRQKRPWIIVFGHHPMYCSSPDRPECKDFRMKNALEELLMQYGVDLELWAHVHGYERLWPVYDFAVKSGTSEPYTNPNAPVHITSGAAGNKEYTVSWGRTHPAWSAFQSSDYGYSTIKIYNTTHLHIKYTSVNINQIIDDFWLVKTTAYPSYYRFGKNDQTQDQQPPTPKPKQVHLSLGVDESEMVVTWMTEVGTNASVVEYGERAAFLNLRSLGEATIFTDGGSERRVTFIHRVNMPVNPGHTYYYRVGTGASDGWSTVFNFTAPRRSTDNWTPRVAYFGDLGLIDAKSLPFLQSSLRSGDVNVLIHAGDFAYDMEMENGRLGDRFMQMIEPLAAYAPYMTCVGNHEVAYNFSHYTNRFSMPGGSNNSLFYSFNYAAAHFIAIDTEVYYTNPESIMTQYNWLVNDLKVANLPTNRAIRPWIILFGHRPMFCGNPDRGDCVDRTLKNALEDLLMQYGVDLELWAHVHAYERLWPMYNFTVKSGTTIGGEPHVNPNAPIHIMSGAAGNKEVNVPWGNKQPSWSAFQSSDYGFSTIKIYNTTHLHIKYFSVNQNQIIDDIWVVKTSPYPSYYHPPQ